MTKPKDKRIAELEAINEKHRKLCDLLETQIQHKDAECQAKIDNLNRVTAIDYIIDLVKRAKKDSLGLPDSEMEFIGKLAKEIWNIKRLGEIKNADCQASVKELADCLSELVDIFQGLLDGEQQITNYDSITLQPARQALKKQEGVE